MYVNLSAYEKGSEKFPFWIHSCATMLDYDIGQFRHKVQCTPSYSKITSVESGL